MVLTTRCEVEDVTVADRRSVNGNVASTGVNSHDEGGKKVLQIQTNASVFKVFSFGFVFILVFVFILFLFFF